MTQFERVLVDKVTMTRLLDVAQIKNMYFFAGSSSLTIPSLKKKYILKSRAIEWPDKFGEIIPMTAGEIARVELGRAFPDLKKVGWSRRDVQLFDISPPVFFSEPRRGYLWYVDLRAAYWQLYRKLWLDTKVPCGSGKYQMGPLARKLESVKIARNSVIGNIRSRSISAFKGFKRLRIQSKNRFLSPHLWGTIQFLLHEIAVGAKTAGAVYASTDGYIFSRKEDMKTHLTTLWAFGLDYTVLEGEGAVLGWGRWKIGDKQTKTFGLGPTRPISNLTLYDKSQSVKFLTWWSKLKE